MKEKVWENGINYHGIQESPERFVVRCFAEYYVLDTKTGNQVGYSFSKKEDAETKARILNKHYEFKAKDQRSANENK